MRHADVYRLWQARCRTAAALFGVAMLMSIASTHADAGDSVTKLLATSKTVLGQSIIYPPRGAAKVRAVIVTMQPGEQTGWHKHEVPTFGYVLDGELTIDLGPHGKRVYKQGEAFVEALDTAHNGRNLGKTPVRILAVFMGAEGVPTTVMMPPPG